MRISAYRYRGERREVPYKYPAGRPLSLSFFLALSFTDFLIVSQLQTFGWSSVLK